MIKNYVLQDKNIAILGYGITGKATAAYLSQQGAKFSIYDMSVIANNIQLIGLQKIVSNWQINEKDLQDSSYIVVSPGMVKHLPKIAKLSHKIITDLDLFCAALSERKNKAKLLAITGTNGKSTVVSILHHVLQKMDHKVELLGNIGKPLLEIFINKKHNYDYIVMELSSFQLKLSNNFAFYSSCILNIAADHLDEHEDIHDYINSKLKIHKQSKNIVINADMEKQLLQKINNCNGEKFYYSLHYNKNLTTHFYLNSAKLSIEYQQNNKQKKLIEVSLLPLLGVHNISNYLAVYALLASIHIEANDIAKHLVTFHGLPYRCQLIKNYNNIQWINDSKATNEHSLIAAVSGIRTINSSHSIIVLAGGLAKNQEFTKITSLNVQTWILFGKDKEYLAQKLKLHRSVYKVEDLLQAINLVNKILHKNTIILFSPGCASFDQYKNFMERGAHFDKLVADNTNEKQT